MFAVLYLPSDRQLDIDVLDLVDRFNDVAQDTTISVKERIFLLKQIFNVLTDYAMQEIDWARAEPDYMQEALDRADFIADVMDKKGYCNAPDLVQWGVLDQDYIEPEGIKTATIWRPLGVYRDKKLSALRLSIDAMKRKTDPMYAQQKEPRLRHLTRSNWQLGEPLADAQEDRIVHVRAFLDHPLRRPKPAPASGIHSAAIHSLSYVRKAQLQNNRPVARPL